MEHNFIVYEHGSYKYVIGVEDADGDLVAAIAVTWWREKWVVRDGVIPIPNDLGDGAIRAVEAYLVRKRDY